MTTNVKTLRAILGKGISLNAAEVTMMRKLGELKKGESLTYMTGATGDPMKPVGRVALAYHNVKKVELKQRRLTDSTSEKVGNGTFEYVATGLTDDGIVPRAYKYLDD